MSFAVTVGETLARSAAVGAGAVAIGVPIRAAIEAMEPRVRRVVWIALIAVFLTPVMLIGYAYSDFLPGPLVRHAWLREPLYGLLQALRLTPVAVLVLHVAPRHVSPEAAFLYRLTNPRPLERFRFWLRGGARVPAAAFGLLFLLTFTDHELASLMQVRNWSVSLFDGRAGGVPLIETLRHALLPAAIALGVLFGIALLSLRSLRFEAAPAASGRRPSPFVVGVTWAYLVVAALAVTVFPATIVMGDTFQGLGSLKPRILVPDLSVSLGLAVVSALAAFFLAGALRRRATIAIPLAIPGLLGPLVLALAILLLFQYPPFRLAYDSPAPLLLALVLLLLPLAIMVRLPLDARRAGQALHTARLLLASPDPALRRAARRTAWRLKFRGHVWVVLFLLWWAYLDLTAGAILAPPGATPIAVTLYNQMHYGRNAVLSATLAVAIAVPLMVLVVPLGVRGLFRFGRTLHG